MNYNALPSSGYLRLFQITGRPTDGIPPLIPVCNATIWNWVKTGKFPKPIKLSSRVTVWSVDDVMEYMNANK